jgi:hypothetical protein
MKILNDDLKKADDLDVIKDLFNQVKDIYMKVDKMSKSNMFRIVEVENKAAEISAHPK